MQTGNRQSTGSLKSTGSLAKSPFARAMRRIGAVLIAGALLAPLSASATPPGAPVVARPAPPAAAGAATPVRHSGPALWVVRDEDTTIYLFGTVHVLRPGMNWFNPTIRNALAQSDELFTEIPQRELGNTLPLLLRRAIARDGVRLSQRLTPEQRAIYQRALAHLGAPPTMFEQVEPWVPAFMMGSPSGRYSREHGVETVLFRTATEMRKRQFGLESSDMQLGFFDHMSEEAQIRMLMGAAKSTLNPANDLDAIVNAWARGDVDVIAQVADGDVEEFPEFHEAILTNRNTNWAQWISMRIAEPGQSFFVAVGAAHLAGRDSVQNILARDYGLTATRIDY